MASSVPGLVSLGVWEVVPGIRGWAWPQEACDRAAGHHGRVRIPASHFPTQQPKTKTAL